MSEQQQTEDIETKAVRGRRYSRRSALNGDLPNGDIVNGNGNGDVPSASGEDVALAFDEFMRAFEAFKLANDERLAQIEQSISEDVVTTEKLDRINRAMDQHQALMDQLTLKAARPHLSGLNIRSSGALLQHKAAFEAYVRHGEANGLHLIEQKALSVGSGPDGGYLVPPETEAAVIRGVKNISPIRAIAGNRTVSASVYKKPFAITGPVTGWVAETATRPETNSPALAELVFPTMELYAMPSATQALLDDSVVNIDEWLAEEIQVAFAQQEGTAFVNGTGTNQPKGFLKYTTIANASWAWDKIGYIVTGE
ncbi:MAG: phage major capsid protein, partial [Methyloceanibacter sp.]